MMANAPDSIQTRIKDKHKELNKKIGEIEVKFMEPEDVKGYTNPINLNIYLNSQPAATSIPLSALRCQCKRYVKNYTTLKLKKW
jgi:hypothetical protein